MVAAKKLEEVTAAYEKQLETKQAEIMKKHFSSTESREKILAEKAAELEKANRESKAELETAKGDAKTIAESLTAAQQSAVAEKQ